MDLGQPKELRPEFTEWSTRVRKERAQAEEERAMQWNAEQNAKYRAQDEAAVPEANRQTPAEQRGIMACLIDVCVANTMLPCPMGNCIACRERDAAWETLYRLLEPKHQEMVQRFLVHAELLPPGMPERDR